MLSTHVHLSSGSLVYLAVAYALFFVLIFAYVLSLSRRQERVQDDLVLLRQAVEEEKRSAFSPQPTAEG